MITKELIQKYYDHWHLTRTDSSDESDRVCLIPYFLMDVSYSYYEAHIRGYNASFGEKYAKTLWTNCQNRFMRELSCCYTADEYGIFLDGMDELRKYLEHDLFILHIQGMNCFVNILNLKDQEILAAALVANKLAFEAAIVYAKTRTNGNGRYIQSKDLGGVLSWSKSFCKNFLDLRGKGDAPVGDGEYLMVERASKALKNKITKWIDEEMK